MITFLSQKLKFLLILVLVVIGISFIFFGDWSHGQGRAVTPAKIAGRTISLTEYQNAIRAERLVFTLNSGQLPPSGTEADRLFAQRAWQRLLILEQARESGPAVPPSRLDNLIRANPLFIRPDNGEYAPEQFARFKQFVLDPQGISPERFLEILRDQVLIEEWIESVHAAAIVQPAEPEQRLHTLFGRVSMFAVEIPAASVQKEIQITDEALRAFYDRRPERYQLPEQRKFEVVFFRLPPSADKMSESDRAAARRSLGEKAYQFTEPFYNATEAGTPLPDFAATARAKSLNVETTPYLARSGAFPGVREGSSLLEAAFLLTPERPVSDYIAIPEGFAVLHLLDIQPPTLRPFDQVKADVRAAYLQSETNQRLQAVGENLVLRLRKELAEGRSWPQATAAAGVRSTPLPAFVPANDTGLKLPDAETVRAVATRLNPGGVSELIVRDGKAMILHLASREQPDPATRDAALPRLRDQLIQERRFQTRTAWINALQQQPRTVSPLDLN